MNLRWSLAVCMALVATVALAAIPLAVPLTNEDVVRMVASGIPEREILEAIRSRPEAFDLADDMVDELKLAGVASSVLAAMGQRHAENAPPAPPAERPTRGRAPLVVILNGGAAGPRTLHVPAWADEDTKARLHLQKESEQREVNDLAVFLACASPEHIPELWRSKSPLGRDMISVPRHEMLAFVAGDTPAGKPPLLALPARIEAEVDEGESHDLIVGIAARFGDRWMQLAIARLPKASIGAGQKPLIARIEHNGRGFDFTLQLSAQRSP